MKRLFFFLLSSCAIPAIAQQQLIGWKAGFGLTHIQAYDFIRDNEHRPGVSGGITYEYRLKHGYFLGGELSYQQRGFINYLEFTDKSGNPTGERYPSNFRYDYLSVPLRAGFFAGKKLYSYAAAGLCPSLLVHATTKTPVFTVTGIEEVEQTGWERYNVTKQVNRLDLAGLLELGGGYQYHDRYWLFASVGFQYSFTSITNRDYFSGSDVRHYGYTLSLGMKYALARKAPATAAPVVQP